MNTYLLVGLVAVAVLYFKGYIRLPGKTSGSKSGDLGVKFITTLQAEAQAEAAIEIATKLKDEVKAKLYAPFGIPLGKDESK